MNLPAAQTCNRSGDRVTYESDEYGRVICWLVICSFYGGRGTALAAFESQAESVKYAKSQCPDGVSGAASYPNDSRTGGNSRLQPVFRFTNGPGNDATTVEVYRLPVNQKYDWDAQNPANKIDDLIS